MNIRKAVQEDKEPLFDLRNEPEVRLASWNSDLIEFAQHQKWLASTLVNPKKAFFVVEDDGPDGEKKLVGQIRYDLEDDAKAEVSVSVFKAYAGKGYGTKSLIESSKMFFNEFPGVKKVVAHIKPDNVGSIKSFAKAGYSAPKEVDYEGHNCLEMIFNRPR